MNAKEVVVGEEIGQVEAMDRDDGDDGIVIYTDVSDSYYFGKLVRIVGITPVAG